jgi:cobalt/nickel transport system ATP-binding protein
MDYFMIKLKDVCYQYQTGEEVLADFNLNLETGEKLALVGPNGSGKTTIFKLIMGLLKPDSGRIILFDQLRESENDFEAVREKIGFLFQEPENQLFCPTVKEELAFGPLNLGWDRKKVEEISQQVLSDLGIIDLKNKVPWHLSGGQKKLVALGSILTLQPDLLLLDEPFAGLDQATKNKLLDLLPQLAESYIIVSHDEQLLAQVTNDVHYLG